jgi:hypothetical protein
MRTCFGAAAAALLSSAALAQDPASSWLAYTVARGNGSLVTFVNATWAVPAFPSSRSSPSAPGVYTALHVEHPWNILLSIVSTVLLDDLYRVAGWWFGIEPEPADYLIQPILAYGDGQNAYTIFNGECTQQCSYC